MPLIGVIGDIHAHFAHLDRVLEHLSQVDPDGILLVGDLGSHHLSLASRRTPERDARYLASIDEVFRRVRGLGLPVLWVPGNHDLPDLQGPGNVDGKVDELAGLTVTGIGGAGPARFGFCYEWGEDAIRARPEPSADVILSHAPPAQTPIDWVPGSGSHVGSQAVRERAERTRGFLVCGHIHESPGAVLLQGCLCLNAGGLGHPFGRPQVGYLRRQDGVDAVGHEDLVDGTSRWWTHEDAPRA